MSGTQSAAQSKTSVQSQTTAKDAAHEGVNAALTTTKEASATPSVDLSNVDIIVGCTAIMDAMAGAEPKVIEKQNFFQKIGSFFASLFGGKKGNENENASKALSEMTQEELVSVLNNFLAGSSASDLKKLGKNDSMLNRFITELPVYGLTAFDYIYSYIENSATLASAVEARANDPAQSVLVANNAKQMRYIMSKLSQSQLVVLDKLYDDVTESASNTKLMIEMIYARFGVPLGSSMVEDSHKSDAKKFIGSKTEVSWTFKGAQHVYQTYTQIPQADLDLIHGVFTFNTNQSVNGGASYNLRSYFVNYDENTIDNPIGVTGAKTDLKSDARVGLIAINMTTAHELGHVVDGNHKGGTASKVFGGEEPYGYSNMDSFRACSSWDSVGVSKKSDVVDFMIKCMSNEPYSTNTVLAKSKISADNVKATAKEIGAMIIDESKTKADSNSGGDVSSWTDAKSFIGSNIAKTTYGKENPGQKSELKSIFSEEEDSNLIHQLWKSLAFQNAYMYQYAKHGGKRAGLKAPFHQSYTWKKCWYTFDASNWTNKISSYQYRDPGEEFAETYGSFFVSKASLSPEELKKDPKTWNVKTPEKLKNWFIENGLHNMDKQSEDSSK